MKTRTAHYLVVLLSAIAPSANALLPARELGAWNRLPLELPPNASIQAIAADNGGGLWAFTPAGLFWWNGHQVASVAGISPVGGSYGWPVGGGDRELYSIQRARDRNKAHIYRLKDGAAQFVVDAYVDNPDDHHRLVLVANDHRLVNYGNRFVETLVNGDWIRSEARLHSWNTLTFEALGDLHLYHNGNLYSSDPSGAVRHRKVPCPYESVPGSRYVAGALLGDSLMVIHEGWGAQVFVYDLLNSAVVDVRDVNALLGSRGVGAAVRDQSGDVHLFAQGPGAGNAMSLKITVKDDDLLMGQSPGEWHKGLRLRDQPLSLLFASDGSIWRARNTGVARIRQYGERTYDWRDGLPSTAIGTLVELPEGRIAALTGDVFLFDPRMESQFSPPPHWTEHRLTLGPFRDATGGIWGMLRERPNTVSRWDGGAWRHLELGRAVQPSGRAVVLDNGDFLVAGDHPSVYRVNALGATEYAGWKAAISAAVADGARSIVDGHGVVGLVVEGGGRIWFATEHQGVVDMFDGEEWSSLRTGWEVAALLRSTAHSVLVSGDRAQSMFYFDRGQLIRISGLPSQSGAALWGPDGIQPFESEFLSRQPVRHWMVSRGLDGWYFGQWTNGVNSAGIAQGPRHLFIGNDNNIRLLPAFAHGARTRAPYGCASFRLLGANLLKCSTNEFPLSGRCADVVIDDAAGNVWVKSGNTDEGSRIFVKDLSSFRIECDPPPRRVGRRITVDASAYLSGEAYPIPYLLSRMDNGEWSSSVGSEPLTLRFDRSGAHSVELIGMEPLGGITPVPLAFSVEADVSLPETLLEMEGPFIIRDIIWKPPVTPRATSDDAPSFILFNIDGGAWTRLDVDRRMPFGGVAIGQHTVEFAAIEEDYFRDQTPAVAIVNFHPDYGLMVETRLPALVGDDGQVARQAVEELKLAGPEVIPVLRGFAMGAQAAGAPWQTRAARLQRTIDSLENAFKNVQP